MTTTTRRPAHARTTNPAARTALLLPTPITTPDGIPLPRQPTPQPAPPRTPTSWYLTACAVLGALLGTAAALIGTAGPATIPLHMAPAPTTAASAPTATTTAPAQHRATQHRTPVAQPTRAPARATQPAHHAPAPAITITRTRTTTHTITPSPDPTTSTSPPPTKTASTPPTTPPPAADPGAPNPIAP